MDESNAASADFDQTDQDLLAHEVPDAIVEAAAGGTKWVALDNCRMTFGGFPSTTAACCGPA